MIRISSVVWQKEPVLADKVTWAGWEDITMQDVDAPRYCDLITATINVRNAACKA